MTTGLKAEIIKPDLQPKLALVLNQIFRSTEKVRVLTKLNTVRRLGLGPWCFVTP